MSTSALERLALTGTYRFNVDEKGRVIVPSAFVDELSSKINQEYYLLAMPEGKNNSYTLKIKPVLKTDYETKAAEFNKKPEDDAERKQFFNHYLLKMDNYNRINLTLPLMTYMGWETKADVLIAGCGNYFEIYKPEQNSAIQVVGKYHQIK